MKCGSSRPGRIAQRWLAALVLGVCASLALPAAASAATAQVIDGRLLFTGGEDERNTVSLAGTARTRDFRFTLVDSGASVLRAGPGCVSTSVNSVRCDASQFFLLTGTGADMVVFPGVPGRAPPGRIDAGPGNDGVASGAPAVHMRGGPGNDVLFSRPPATGNSGSMRGNAGADRLVGRAQAGPRRPTPNLQRLFGGSGDDQLTGGEELFGGDGNDRLDGQAGSDRLRGERGRDALIGAGGRDRFSGGSGRDRINTASGDPGGVAERVFCGSGADRVTPNAADRLARSCNLVDEPDERMTALPAVTRAGFRFRLRCKRSDGCRGALRLRRPGRRAYGRRRYALAGGESDTIVVRLGARARAALARRGGLRTRVTTGALGYTIVLKR